MATTAGQDITVPGGVKVFFTETGGTERDLGNIVGDSVSIARDTEELEHFTNRSGQRRKDKVITVEESAQIDFELDEINVDNLRYFFKGGSISTVGAGTANITNQKETLTGDVYIGLEKPGLTAITVRGFLDSVFLDDGGVFADHTAEALSLTGEFTSINTSDDFLYMGKKTKWNVMDIDVGATPAVHVTPLWEYWNGSAWTTFTPTGSAAIDFSADSTITLDGGGALTGWTTNAVNSVTQYWVRFSAATVTTPGTVVSLGRSAVTALSATTDYNIDPGLATSNTSTQNGAVRRLSGGVILDGEEVMVDFTYVTFTSQTFGIAETSSLEGSARFEALPGTGRGRKWQMTIPKCQLVNNGTMDLDDTDFETIPLSLVVLDNFDCDPVNPFGTVTVFPHS
jgi:hypothetical protein